MTARLPKRLLRRAPATFGGRAQLWQGYFGEISLVSGGPTTDDAPGCLDVAT